MNKNDRVPALQNDPHGWVALFLAAIQILGYAAVIIITALALVAVIP